MSLHTPTIKRFVSPTICSALLFALACPTFGKKGGNKPPPDPPPPPPIVFSVLVLDADPDSLQAVQMNDLGQVVGRAVDPAGERFAAFWPAGSAVPMDLNLLIDPAMGRTLLYADAINNSGQIAGWMRDESGVQGTWTSYRLSLPEAGPPVLESLETPAFSLVRDINEFGDVVIKFGASVNSYLFTNELGLRPLNSLNASSINNVGQVAGSVQINFLPSWNTILYSVNDDQWVNLTPESFDSAGYDLNDSGAVVGYFGLWPSLDRHAFVWTAADGIVDLGTLGGEISTATSINNSGLIVGESTTYKPKGKQPPAPSVGFLYIEGQMHKLLAEVADGGLIADGGLPSGWDQALRSGTTKINNNDQIGGWVQLADGTYRMFVLTPVVP